MQDGYTTGETSPAYRQTAPATTYTYSSPAPTYTTAAPTATATSQYAVASQDSDFLSRLRTRDIVTPGASEVAGAHGACNALARGYSIHDVANVLTGAPYNYSASLAGYFAGEAVKVYCPEYSGQLSSN